MGNRFSGNSSERDRERANLDINKIEGSSAHEEIFHVLFKSDVIFFKTIEVYHTLRDSVQSRSCFLSVFQKGKKYFYYQF